MANTVSISMTSDNKDLLKAFQTQNREIEKLKSKLDDAVKSAKAGEQVGKVARHNAREVEKLTRELAEATSKNEQLADSAKAGEKAAVSLEKYRRKVDDLQGELVEAKAAHQKLTNEAKDWEKAARVGERYRQKVEQLRDKLRQTKEEQKAAVTDANAGIKAAIVGFTGVGTAIAGIHAAAQVLRAEWENLKRRQEDAASKNLSLAEVLPGTLRAAGGLLSAEQVETSVSTIAQETNVDAVTVARAIEDALAARGATNQAEAQSAIDAARAALRFAPEADAGTVSALAGGTTDIQRRFGVDAETAIGFLARVGGQARVTSLREQVQNINPAVGAITAFGGTAAEAGGLVSTLTGLTGDFTGAQSATASIQLAKQLEDRGFGSTMEGLRALQADPELRRRFFEGGKFNGKKFTKATFEARAFPFIRQLATGGSAEAQNLDASIREVGSFRQGRATYSSIIDEQNSLQSVQLANLQRALSSGANQISRADTGGATAAITREGLQKILQASGSSAALGQKTLMTQFELATGGGESAAPEYLATQFRRQARGLTAETEFVGRSAVRREVSDEDRALAEVLGRVAAALDNFSEQQKEDKPRKVEVVNQPNGQRARPAAALSVR